MATNVLGGSGQGNTANPVDILSTDKNLPSDLRSQLNSLMIRIEELQMENEILHSRISRCQCSEVKETENFIYASANSEGTCLSTKSFKDQSMAESNFNTSLKNKSEVSSAKGKHDLHVEKFANSMSYGQAKQIGCQHVTMREYAKRHVALKIMYFGQRFYGFASEAQIEPTVESEIFKALERTKLLVGSRKDSHYSRCGRTDKGVSATGQVISLYLRSNGKGIGAEEDINYAMVLNRVLPKDIRVTGLSHVPLDFSARFSCLSREYRYLFWRESMDISIMQKAAKKFIGEHDFRNFCKMDAVNVSNYRRHITEFTISPWSISSNDDNLWAVTIKGSAFLWHQVRCMVSVLFMIGEGLESPHIIDVLLDINKTPRKPQYIMASEIPLVLHCCEFQGVNFICSSDAKQNLQEYLTNELKGYLLQAAIVEEALNCLQTPGVEGSSVDQHKKKGHIPLTLRPTEPSYEERKAKWAMKPAYKRADL